MKLGSLNVSWSYIDQKTTVCTIANREGIATGITKLSDHDSFNKNVARKTSLERAMKSMKTLTKAQRRNVWIGYKTMTKTPRW